jgi:AmmeMemoRadiSam system protein B
MLRYPIVAGQFYSDRFDELTKELDLCFKKGPKSAGKRTDKKLVGVIAPHAGYFYSGSTAAFSYKAIAESEFPDIFVILGVSHGGFDSCASKADWETPLGVVKNDVEFTESLKIKIDEKAHASEHSIEVQLPFLQYANKDRLKDIRICPIMINETKGIAEKIMNSAVQLNKKIIVIASSDFTHYGQSYGYAPFSSNIKENLHKLDNGAIAKIIAMDKLGFSAYVEKTGATICGSKPISVLIEYLKFVGAKQAKLLKYSSSGEVSHDFTNAVGYASIVFY